MASSLSAEVSQFGTAKGAGVSSAERLQLLGVPRYCHHVLLNTESYFSAQLKTILGMHG